jgi:Restriction endonuclease BglII
MNRQLRDDFRAAGWTKEPVAAGPMAGPDAPLYLRGDFVRNKVFVEVEFGNVASMHRDFFKFQIASRSGAGEVGVLVVATERFAAFFDTNVATNESALRNKPYLAIGVQMPIWVIGIEPEDFTQALKPRYDEMHELCARNDLACHPFETVLRAPLPEASSADVDE